MTLVAIDADVLGRERTGDETYVRNLLRELALLAPAAGIRLAALTRRPDLVPDGVEPVEVRTRSQIARMALTLPRVLRRLGADLVHTQYALPQRLPCPGVVTVHDLSFEREPELFGFEGPPRVSARGTSGGATGSTRPHGLRADEARSHPALRRRPGPCRGHPERRRPGVRPLAK